MNNGYIECVGLHIALMCLITNTQEVTVYEKKDRKWQKANLQASHLQNAHIEDAQLQETDLREADLRGTRLTAEQMRGANLQGARLCDANVTEEEHKIAPEARFKHCKDAPKTLVDPFEALDTPDHNRYDV